MKTELSVVGSIVQSVFESMLGLSTEENECPWYPEANRLTAAVHLTGSWNGVVLIECTGLQACGFAARFLSAEPSDEVDDVVRDVLGELANMIGGNLKCTLGHGIYLSMPSVVDGDYRWRVCCGEVVERLSFGCDLGTFWVTVVSNVTGE